MSRSSYIRVASIHGVAIVSFLLFNVKFNLGCMIHRGKLSCMECFSAALNLGYSISSVKRKETNATVRIDVTLIYELLIQRALKKNPIYCA